MDVPNIPFMPCNDVEEVFVFFVANNSQQEDKASPPKYDNITSLRHSILFCQCFCPHTIHKNEFVVAKHHL